MSHTHLGLVDACVAPKVKCLRNLDFRPGAHQFTPIDQEPTHKKQTVYITHPWDVTLPANLANAEYFCAAGCLYIKKHED